MGESPETSPSVKPTEGRLDSWKEIAAYLNRDVTTVQRWEKREGMPVHRHVHSKLGSIYAFRRELDEWALARNIRALDAERKTEGSSDPDESPPTFLQAKPSLRWKFIGVVIAFICITAIGTGLWLQRKEYFWKSPLADARVQPVTEFGGTERAAAISRDAQFVAFLSDRDGKMDVWVTQLGSGQFHNLTRGSAPELVNPSVRTLGFSPDGSQIAFWARRQSPTSPGDIGIWAVPTLGGQPAPYLENVAEFEWSRDTTQLAYHTPGPGDPLFVTDGPERSNARPIYTAPAGLHSHFPLWSPDSSFLYFVQGALPDKLDIWRIPAAGGTPERITFHNGRVSYPVFLDRRTLLYLASDRDGSGPWLYSMDIARRVPHRLNFGLDGCTSLAASADGSRLVLTVAKPRKTLWRLRLDDSPAGAADATRVALNSGNGSSPRFGPDYLIYVSSTGTEESLWKVSDGGAAELWRDSKARILGSPAISPDARLVAFSVQESGHTVLRVMDAGGTHSRVVTDSFDLQGSPAWTPDSQSITFAANDHGTPHLFRVQLDGAPSPTPFVRDYSTDPTWAPNAKFVIYSGPDIGTTFSVKAATSAGEAHPLPTLTLTRGARHLVFLRDGHSLIVMKGEIQHKNLWLVDLDSGKERQLTNFPADFDIRDFDISSDGREAVVERLEARSDIVLLDLPR